MPRFLARTAALHALFFVSGFLGLAYEVLWMRQFTVLFGGTVLAATATLSAFFLGTTLGSVVLGARSSRWSRPLQVFGILEIGVGASALLVPLLLRAYQALYPSLYAILAPFPVGFAMAKLLLAVLAVGLPTFFMGGTLPALAEGLSPARRTSGSPVGGLYAVNVLGSALGALSVPFVLLPGLGVRGAYLAAVAGSLMVGALAALLGSRMTRPEEGPVPRGSRGAGPKSGISRAAVFAFAAWSGLATLGLEVLWTRMFSLVHENSVYSFSVVVVVFLAGLSGGAALAGVAVRRGHAPARLLGWAWSAGGVLIALSPRLFFYLTGGLEYVSARDGMSATGRLLLVALAALLPAAIALGAGLPLLIEMAGKARRSAGAEIGRLLGANTAGAILGPLAATFLLGPALGLSTSLVVVGVATVAAGSLAGLGRGERWGAWTVVAVVLLGLAPTAVPAARVRAEAGERLVSVREGSYGTTAVVEDDHDRWITVNNSYVLGGAAAAGEERWQAHLPLLLHPSPSRVAFLGLGTGISAGGALVHPVKKIVALEIVPEVVAAAGEDFADSNAHLLADPRVEAVIDDGRNYLGSTVGGFDVIVGDLLVPWRPNESALYTEEHFASVRRALAPGGLFCQWLPLYQLSEAQFAILARTFTGVFPRTTLWRGGFLPGAPTLALVGQRDGGLDVEGIDRRALLLAPSIDGRNPFLKHPEGMWLFLVGPLEREAAWLARSPRNRDDEPWVELMNPRGERIFSGAALEDRLDAVARDALAGTPLAGLDASHRASRDKGMALARASLDPSLAGEERVLAILRTLPEELRRALGVR